MELARESDRWLLHIGKFVVGKSLKKICFFRDAGEGCEDSIQ